MKGLKNDLFFRIDELSTDDSIVDRWNSAKIYNMWGQLLYCFQIHITIEFEQFIPTIQSNIQFC